LIPNILEIIEKDYINIMAYYLDKTSLGWSDDNYENESKPMGRDTKINSCMNQNIPEGKV
jgi:hypothetical protein